MAIIKPSSWLKYLAESPSWFKRLMLGATSHQERENFWQNARQIKEWEFLCPKEADSGVTIPFKLHGDKGPYYKKRSLQVFSISSLFSHCGDSLLTRLALCCLSATKKCLSNQKLKLCFLLAWKTL